MKKEKKYNVVLRDDTPLYTNLSFDRAEELATEAVEIMGDKDSNVVIVEA